LLKCFLVAIALFPLKNLDFPLILTTAKLFIPISIPIGGNDLSGIGKLISFE